MRDWVRICGVGFGRGVRFDFVGRFGKWRCWEFVGVLVDWHELFLLKSNGSCKNWVDR